MKPACIAFLAVLLALPVQAATLKDAMIEAYGSNPGLQKQRAALRVVDEGVAIAKSNARPSADADANIGREYNSLDTIDGTFTPRGVGVTVSQPIYKGGSIQAGISSAEKTVLAQRAQLQAAEQTLFLSVTQSYLDVARDAEVLRLNRKNEDVLGRELKAASDRLKVGEATKTDSSQSESRLAGATADRIQSEGRLAVSQATYMRVVGSPSGELNLPKMEIPLPATLEEAAALAQNNNPAVMAARYSEDAARDDINVAEGSLLPQISLNASAGRDWDQSILSIGRADTAVISANLVMPLYRAGADYARTRAAKETASQRRIEVREAMDQARQQAVSAWQDLAAARSTIGARKKQITATEQALKGVREESKAGTRSVLDRLNAEAETVQAQVDLVQAQRDEILAMFELKAAIGELSAETLNLPVDRYDPQEHYNHVKDKWIGTGIKDEEAMLPRQPLPPASQAAPVLLEAKPIVAEVKPEESKPLSAPVAAVESKSIPIVQPRLVADMIEPVPAPQPITLHIVQPIPVEMP